MYAEIVTLKRKSSVYQKELYCAIILLRNAYEFFLAKNGIICFQHLAQKRQSSFI